MPSLPHINVVGSMITTTHGSGHKYNILTLRITEFDLVLADGLLKTLNAMTNSNFGYYLVNLNGLGVITSITIVLVEKFMVNKSIYQNLQ